MAIKWISYIWDYTDYRDGSALVALALADFANEEGKCYPKMETVAKKARLSVRQVQRIIKAFEQDGFVEIVRHYGRGKEPEFLLKKVTSVTPFKDRKKVTSVTLKGDICDTEKVTSVTSTIYKDEPLIEPSMNRGGNTTPTNGATSPKSNGNPPPSKPDLKPKGNIIAIYGEYFPNSTLTPYQLDLLRKENLQAAAWRRTLQLWAANGNNPKNIGDLLDRYRKEAKRKPDESAKPAQTVTAQDIDQMEAAALARIK